MKNRHSISSHKLAASLAGLGWIGKNCLLITPDHGPRVRWGTILTNASLEAGTPMEVKCGECTECVEACPAQTFTGQNFIPLEPRETRMIIERHIQYFKEQEEKIGKGVCGRCVLLEKYNELRNENS